MIVPIVLGSAPETSVHPVGRVRSATTPVNVPLGVSVSVIVTRVLTLTVESEPVNDFVQVGLSTTVTWLPVVNGVAVVEPLTAETLTKGGL